VILAHGIGGIRDLPVPNWLFFYGAAAVLLVSFLALGILWKRPLLERHEHGRSLRADIARAVLSPGLRVVLGALSVFLLAVVWLSAAIGTTSAGSNLAPTFVYVVFWLGLVPLTVVFGNVWSVLNPWKAAADGTAWVSERLGFVHRPPFDYPERLGRWPAAVLLLCFATLELAYSDPSSPRALAGAILLYSAITWLGMLSFGRVAWLENGEAFTSYFGMLARIAPFAAVEGRVVLRWPLTGLARQARRPGTIAFLSVMLGSVFFDGFSRTSLWQNRFYDVQIHFLDQPSRAELIGILMNLGALLLCVTAVGLAFEAAVLGARELGRGTGHLGNAFVLSLAPIAFVYAVAHYFSLLVIQGQVAVKLASDPFGYGWNLFGTGGFQPDPTVLTPNTIWYVQVGALVAGHVAGLAVAHDRSLSLFRPTYLAVRSQYPMLALMVLYTVGGLWVLSQG
jgi:hypothetical protein